MKPAGVVRNGYRVNCRTSHRAPEWAPPRLSRSTAGLPIGRSFRPGDDLGKGPGRVPITDWAGVFVSPLRRPIAHHHVDLSPTLRPERCRLSGGCRDHGMTFADRLAICAHTSADHVVAGMHGTTAYHSRRLPGCRMARIVPTSMALTSVVRMNSWWSRRQDPCTGSDRAADSLTAGAKPGGCQSEDAVAR